MPSLFEIVRSCSSILTGDEGWKEKVKEKVKVKVKVKKKEKEKKKEEKKKKKKGKEKKKKEKKKREKKRICSRIALPFQQVGPANQCHIPRRFISLVPNRKSRGERGGASSSFSILPPPPTHPKKNKKKNFEVVPYNLTWPAVIKEDTTHSLKSSTTFKFSLSVVHLTSSTASIALCTRN